MILRHEGFIAVISYEDGDELMHGVTQNTRSVLHFAGKTVDELKAAFAETISDYRAWCAERGVEPEKGYSGSLSLRLPPMLHQRVSDAAAAAGESINQFIVEKLEASVSNS